MGTEKYLMNFSVLFISYIFVFKHLWIWSYFYFVIKRNNFLHLEIVNKPDAWCLMLMDYFLSLMQFLSAVGGLGAAGLSASLLTSVLPTTLEDLLALGLCSAGG